MFLEDPQIDLPYSCHAITRSWLVHGFADQGARLYVGDTLASPSTLFQIDHHAAHTHPESEARVGNLAHCAFSSAISGNVRIFGGNPLIWNYQSCWPGPSIWLCNGNKPEKVYADLAKTFQRDELRPKLKGRFDRFAILNEWNYAD